MTQTIEPTKVQIKQIRTFSLSPSFLSEFKDKQPEWGYNGLGYVVYKRCVHIDTPVLCADLSWKPAGELKMGEQLLAFEEGSMKRGTSNKKPRHMLISTVTDNSVELAECVKITLSNGDQLICTADHSWLVRTGYGLEWVEAKDLLSRKKCEFIKYADVWKQDTSFDAGYLAGAFDGEGSLDRRRTISFTQTDNAMLSRVKDILTEKGYEFSIHEKKQNKLGKKKCFSLNLYSNAQVMRFLGEIRPSRLLEKYASTVDEMAMRRRSKHVVVSNVVSVESIGIHPIAVLSTTSKTHITAGYPSHNTYAREKLDGNLEEFWETCQRVVEGTYDIQKRHCKTLRLTWDDRKAQRSAQEMYRRMWEFKWLPPGRGLWMMGTPNVERIGSAALNNCAFISTKGVAVDFAQPFCWMMDMLMLGLGVGFDTKGAGLVKIKKPNVTDVPFVVEDSREGWVALLRVVLDSYAGRGALPSVIDYSLVRPFGAPIKGFGGTSSGPDPLIELIKSVQDILNKIVDSELTTSAIVDICNLVGRCVVSGNVRRSAEIAFGDPNDEAFLNLKNPEINQEALNHHRWASNNSIFAEVGMDYSKVAEMTAKNGEPGYQWLENARAYSRMNGVKDFIDALAAGANPCFSGDTLVAVADGRNAVSFKQLAEEGKDVPVYSLTPDGKVEIQWGRNPRMTRESAKLVRIHLDDGSTMDVTPDHNMILRDGSIKKAADLLKGDSLPVVKKYKDNVCKDGKQYWRMETDLSKQERIFEHRLIAKFFEPKKWDEIYNEASASGWIKGGLVVHHKDYNPLNNSPDNLEIMTFKDHSQYHADHDRSGESNGMFGRSHSEETKSLIGAKTSERVANPEFLEKLRASHTTEERAEASTRMKSAKEIWDKKYYLEQEKNTDLQTVWVGEQMFAKKVCEHCSSEFVVPWGKRDRLYCSVKCFNVHLQSLESRKNGQRTAFVNRQQVTLHDQIMAYKDLQDSLKRDPFKREWEQECRSRSLSFRFRSGTSSTVNPHALKSFADLQARAENYNHRVVKVEVLDGEQPVYNITVDKNHTVMVALQHEKNADAIYMQGVCQCVEQTLEDGEICCLVETFPGRHESFEDYRKTLKYAYLYAKTVTLIPTHDHKTNTVVMRNRRIGCSMSGIVQAVQKFGRRKFFTDFCDAGYGYLRELDKKYSGWLCVRTSIKITSVKPSGSVSLLPGVTPGIHFPHSEFYIRRVRLQSSSPLVKVLESSGYHIEKDSYSPNTVVAEFPVHESNFDRSKDSVTLWEQLEMAAQMQQYWADNQVSVTVTFKPEEARDIKYALELYETRLKGVSFLPIEDHGYAQAPYEEITKEEYEKFMSGIRPISAETLAHEETSKFCDGESCTI